MKLTITFGPHLPVTDDDIDGTAFAFLFTVVDSDLVGSPEEESATKLHRVIVSSAKDRQREWGVSDPDLPLVLFEFAKRFVVDAVEMGSLGRNYTMSMPPITMHYRPDITS